MDFSVFAYGTLKDGKIRKYLLSRNVPAKKDSLSGFRIDQISLDGICYPVAIRDPFNKKVIHGVFFKVNEREIKLLDEYESDAYKRIQVILNSGKEAWLYIKA